jgi:rSAM/selenodomain-associated transferase 2
MTVTPPALSVIIPTWNEARRVEAAVRAARALGSEVLVVDAGSTDDTAARAEAAGAVVVLSRRGRGAQLHAGARRATGDVLLFLHADAELPASAAGAIAFALRDEEVVGGNFYLRFVPDSNAARLFTWANHLRRRWLRIYYGDSALFLRRRTYDALGGFRELPILEDYELVRRLERHGRTAYVRDVEVQVSARRFERAPLRTLLVWTWIQVLYSVFGVSPARLARHYADIREGS